MRDPDVELGARGPSERDGDLHEAADPALVERGERVLGQDAALQVLGEKPGLGVVARDPALVDKPSNVLTSSQLSQRFSTLPS